MSAALQDSGGQSSQARDPEATVSLRGIRRGFAQETVLDGVDLEVPRGTVSALLGRNGCGKSTLIRIVAGALSREAGEARVLGRDPELLSPDERLRMVWITDQLHVDPTRRVSEQLEFEQIVRAGRFERSEAERLLTRWEVPLDKRLSQLSRGLQTRFQLALAFAARPELLLLDEPTLGLDLFARRDLLEVIVDVVSELEAAVLVASHQLEDVERIADQITFLHKGHVQAQGSSEGLRDALRWARLAAGEGSALRAACAGLLGIRRVARDPDDPPGEFLVHFSDYSPALQAEVVALSGAEVLEVGRPTLAEVYLEVLGDHAEVA